MTISKTATEGRRPGEFILSEADVARSRENVTLGGAHAFEPGEVVGRITATGVYVALAPAAADGSQTAAGITVYGYDATTADVEGVIIETDAQVIGDALVWPTGISAGDKATAIAALRDRGVKVR